MTEYNKDAYKQFREEEKAMFPKRKGFFQEIYERGIVPHLTHKLSDEYPTTQSSDLTVRICYDCGVAIIFDSSMDKAPSQRRR